MEDRVVRFPTLPWTDAAAHWLSGAPNTMLTLALVAFAAFSLWIAFKASPLVKALVIAWFLLP